MMGGSPGGMRRVGAAGAWPRAVLVCACLTIAASAAAQAPEPNTGDGLPVYQYGPDFLTYWTAEKALIDEVSLNSADGISSGGRALRALVDAGAYDPATETFRMLIMDKPMKVGVVRALAERYPARYAGEYVLTWEGDGSVVMRGGMPRRRKRVGRNRIEMTFRPETAHPTDILIDWIGREGVRNIRFYKKAHEPLLEAGRAFDPEFVDFVSRYKVVRTMNWSGPVSSIVRDMDDIARRDAQFLGTPTQRWRPAGVRRGFPVGLEIQFAMEADVALWTHVQPMLGAPPESIAKVAGAPRDEAELRPGAIAAAADAIAADAAFDQYAAHLAAELAASGYPENRMLYVELGNETWNAGPGFLRTYQYFEALGEGLGLKSSRRAYGYMSARLAEALAGAFAAAGRDQAFTVAIGAQTAWPVPARQALEGVVAYYRRTTGDDPPADAMRRFGLATTTYYSGAMSYKKGRDCLGASSREAWRAAWLKRLEEDAAGLAEALAACLIEGAPGGGGGLRRMMSHFRAHDRLAREFGVRYIGNYEGGSHDMLDEALKRNPAAVAFYRDFQRSERAARVRRAVDEAYLAAFPGKMLSEYNRLGVMEGPFNPWYEQAWGETSPLTETLDAFLRPPLSMRSRRVRGDAPADSQD